MPRGEYHDDDLDYDDHDIEYDHEPMKTTRLVIRSADIAGIVIIRVAGGHSLMLL